VQQLTLETSSNVQQATIIYIASYEKWRRFIKSKPKGEKQSAYVNAFLLF